MLDREVLARVRSEVLERVQGRRRSRIILPGDEELVVTRAVSSFVEAHARALARSEEDARGDFETRKARAVGKAKSEMMSVVEQHLRAFTPKPRRPRSSGSARSGLLSEYEEKRQRMIAANRAVLLELGLASHKSA